MSVGLVAGNSVHMIPCHSGGVSMGDNPTQCPESPLVTGAAAVIAPLAGPGHVTPGPGPKQSCMSGQLGGMTHHKSFQHTKLRKLKLRGTEMSSTKVLERIGSLLSMFVCVTQ